MNEGIQHYDELEVRDAGEVCYSARWWEESKRMVEVGWRFFCRKRHWQVEKPATFRQRTSMEVAEGLAAKRARKCSE